MFDIGQKVKCIDGRWGDATGTETQLRCCPNLPVPGQIYTVRWIEKIVAVHEEGARWFIRLMELSNPRNHYGDEPIFYARQFVPLGRIEATDITFAFKILENPQKTIKRDKVEAVLYRPRKRKRRERA